LDMTFNDHLQPRLTSEITGLYNQTCCRRQVAQLVFCPFSLTFWRCSSGG
jgi:hypothetical protein